MGPTPLGLTALLLPNLPMIMTFPTLRRTRLSKGRWPGQFLTAVGASTLGFGTYVLLRPQSVFTGIAAQTHAIGYPSLDYWLWAASFALVAAVRMDARSRMGVRQA